MIHFLDEVLFWNMLDLTIFTGTVLSDPVKKYIFEHFNRNRIMAYLAGSQSVFGINCLVKGIGKDVGL